MLYSLALHRFGANNDRQRSEKCHFECQCTSRRVLAAVARGARAATASNALLCPALPPALTQPALALLEVQVACEGAHEARIPRVMVRQSCSCAITEITTVVLIIATTIAAVIDAIVIVVVVEAAAVWAACTPGHANEVGSQRQRAYSRRCSGESPSPAEVAVPAAARDATRCSSSIALRDCIGAAAYAAGGSSRSRFTTASNRVGKATATRCSVRSWR